MFKLEDFSITTITYFFRGINLIFTMIRYRAWGRSRGAEGKAENARDFVIKLQEQAEKQRGRLKILGIL
ncbi:MAG: hypothetical protein HWQ38_08840 [Nostoc sp. NMS7]|uniref:hypothetical protein n=1 Tax=Nostoc sp. NMS7 TaxID=2815391 RepID=UPI0025FD8665|nr:hypothetical protein [Nostoc sp. NMS7]MBN3946587.1 hypothetical protein [Nostoc sp. NMS7]